jgi:hypothetical protein
MNTEHDVDQALMCPIVHNVSGTVQMEGTVRNNYVRASAEVNPRRNFGKKRCLYCVEGNIMFNPGDKTAYFKGARSLPALQHTLVRITGGDVFKTRVSMLVMTLDLHTEFDIQENGKLQKKLVETMLSSVRIIARLDNESNSLMFEVMRWDRISDKQSLLQNLHGVRFFTLASVSRRGMCTLRITFSLARCPEQWTLPLSLAHEAAIALGKFLLRLQNLDG